MAPNPPARIPTRPPKELGTAAPGCANNLPAPPPGALRMSSDDAIEFEGKVVEVLSGGTFKVNVGEGHDVIAKLAGKMRRYRIRVVLGDRVTVAVSPYDPTRGRITYRPR